jgi:hypothetical protein
MNTTPQDIIDTLKHGYIPIIELLEHAKTHNFNIDQFKYNDIDEYYSYGQTFSLLWDGDFYYIDCFINPPNLEFDDTEFVTVRFCSGISICNEEQRYFPPLMDHEMSFTIHSRQEFIDALEQWQEFVHTFYGIMLAHRIDIIEDVDKIVKSEKARPSMSKSKKSDYIKWMNQFPLMIAETIEKVLNFKEIKIEEVDMDPIYLSEGVWFDPSTGQTYSE